MARDTSLDQRLERERAWEAENGRNFVERMEAQERKRKQDWIEDENRRAERLEGQG
jgi:hypothetical protein